MEGRVKSNLHFHKHSFSNSHFVLFVPVNRKKYVKPSGMWSLFFAALMPSPQKSRSFHFESLSKHTEKFFLFSGNINLRFFYVPHSRLLFHTSIVVIYAHAFLYLPLFFFFHVEEVLVLVFARLGFCHLFLDESLASVGELGGGVAAYNIYNFTTTSPPVKTEEEQKVLDCVTEAN